MSRLATSIIASAVIAFASGCGSTGTTFRFEQRKNIGMTSVQFGGYDIPVISVSEGPSATAFQSREACCAMRVSGTACTTNRTSALGIYSSEEEKHLRFDGIFITCPTNAVDFSFATNAVSPSISNNAPAK